MSKLKIFLPACFMLFTLTAFAQKEEKPKTEVYYKQLHSGNLDNQQSLFADGIKLKMNLSVLEEAESEKATFDENEIPADDLYGGIWKNSYVNAYGSMANAPDTFRVNLKNFTMPYEGKMTSNFGRRGSRRYHYGVDIKLQTGDTVYAAFDGKIRLQSYERSGYGYYVVIRHPNGLETVYGHLSGFLLKENDVVKSGDPIALGGNTGRSTGSHLHFETRFLGKPINPNFIVDFQNLVCHRDEYLVTNASFRKTTQSSRTLTPPPANSNYKEPTTNAANNKYVAGNVKYYRIKNGDTLGAIARRNGTTVSNLCKLNNITTKTTLRIGKSLRVS